MKDVAEELAKMVAADQKARWAWNEARLDKTADEVTLARVKNECYRVDAENFHRLKTIFSEHGYPDINRFGKEAAHNFWLLVQHSDQEPGFQLQVLAAMEPLLKTGDLTLGNYAYLYDRVHVNTGRLQRYGTQLRAKDDGSGYEPQSLEYPESVDRRREEVGLAPLAEYLALHLAMCPIKQGS